jgi:hypothetical protein
MHINTRKRGSNRIQNPVPQGVSVRVRPWAPSTRSTVYVDTQSQPCRWLFAFWAHAATMQPPHMVFRPSSSKDAWEVHRSNSPWQLAQRRPAEGAGVLVPCALCPHIIQGGGHLPEGVGTDAATFSASPARASKRTMVQATTSTSGSARSTVTISSKLTAPCCTINNRADQPQPPCPPTPSS